MPLLTEWPEAAIGHRAESVVHEPIADKPPVPSDQEVRRAYAIALWRRHHSKLPQTDRLARSMPGLCGGPRNGDG
jgi:hypothetical protein